MLPTPSQLELGEALPNSASASASASSATCNRLVARDPNSIRTEDTKRLWSHFWCLADDPAHVQCKHCSELLGFVNGSTSALGKHFENKHVDLFRVEANSISKQKRASVATGIGAYLTGGTKAYPLAVLKFVVMTQQPLTIVENEYFREMQGELNTRKDTEMGSERLKGMLHKKYSDIKIGINEMLTGEYVAITTDSWTSIANDSYIGTTVHWIDDTFGLHSGPLGVKHHIGKACAEDHVRECIAELKKHLIPLEKVVGVTSDTAAVMNAFGLRVSPSRVLDTTMCIGSNRPAPARTTGDEGIEGSARVGGSHK
jgi:hypothetical protein